MSSYTTQKSPHVKTFRCDNDTADIQNNRSELQSQCFNTTTEIFADDIMSRANFKISRSGGVTCRGTDETQTAIS